MKIAEPAPNLTLSYRLNPLPLQIRINSLGRSPRNRPDALFAVPIGGKIPKLLGELGCARLIFCYRLRLGGSFPSHMPGAFRVYRFSHIGRRVWMQVPNLFRVVQQSRDNESNEVGIARWK